MGAGRTSEGVCSGHFTHGFTDEKALYTGSTWGKLVGSELFCIQCVVSLGPVGRRNVRCSVLSDYACLLARSVFRTSVAGSDWVLPKHRLIS